MNLVVLTKNQPRMQKALGPFRLPRAFTDLRVGVKGHAGFPFPKSAAGLFVQTSLQSAVGRSKQSVFWLVLRL